jgi:hypothetical protein
VPVWTLGRRKTSLLQGIEPRLFGCPARNLNRRHRRVMKNDKVKKIIDEHILDQSDVMTSLLCISSGATDTLVLGKKHLFVRPSRCGRGLLDQIFEAS